jgi:hypothetical protein
MVLLESRTEIRRGASAAAAVVPMAELRARAEVEHMLLEECLDRLTSENRSLIERYYRPQGKSLLEARRQLYIELGITAKICVPAPCGSAKRWRNVSVIAGLRRKGNDIVLAFSPLKGRGKLGQTTPEHEPWLVFCSANFQRAIPTR